MAFRSGKTRGSTVRAKIREELVCAICLDFLKEPKVLNCAHSFCFSCLEKHSQSKYKHRPGSDKQQDGIECPCCKQITRMPPGGVKNLTTNFTLKKILSLVSENERKATRTILSARTVKRHSISRTAPTCSIHSKPIVFFCHDCNELLCPKCGSSTHKKHNFEDVDTVGPKEVQTLRSLIQPACEVATRAEGMMDQLTQKKDQITTNSRSTIEAVQAYFKKVRKVIDQRESALKSTVQKYCDVRLNRIDSQYQMLQNHHDAILDKVGELEKLIDENKVFQLLTQKQMISEDIEAQEQSVIAVGDLLKEASNQGSLLFREGQPPSAFAELGTVNERQQQPNSLFVTLRRLIVSEEEDPYLDVPLRFEDQESQTPQKQVRVDETKPKIEYEPEGKPNATIYNVPTPLNQDPNARKPDVPPRKTSKMSKESDSPPLPPRRPRTRRITPDSNIKRPPEASPKTDWAHDYQNFDPASLRKPTSGPKYAETAHKEQVRKSQTLPSSHYGRSMSSPMVEVPHSFTSSDSSDSEAYESLDDLPTPVARPRTKPPPLPKDHPSVTAPPTPPKRGRNYSAGSDALASMQPLSLPEHHLSQKKSKPKVKPRIHSEASSLDSTEYSQLSRPHKKVFKKRSLTLPTGLVPPLPPKDLPFILTPLKIIDNKMMSSPTAQETVYPNGICCCPEMCDRIVVTDVFNHCLRLLDSNGSFVEKIGKEGRSGGQFKEPSAVAFDSNCNLFVTERDNPRVQKFTASGKYMMKFGQKTLLGSQLGDPMGVVVGNNNSVLITDWDKNEIYAFTNNGRLVDTIGKENNLLKFPAGLAINSKGNILVTDRGNHCVWELTVHGDVVQRIGSKGSEPGQLYFPYGVIVLSDQSIVITESGNNRVSMFSNTGEFIRYFGEKGPEPGQFDHPRYLCVNSLGHVIVVDQMNQRLQVFQVN